MVAVVIACMIGECGECGECVSDVCALDVSGSVAVSGDCVVGRLLGANNISITVTGT